MSIQMTLVFILATIEMVLVTILLLPLPPKVQNYLIKRYDESTSNSNFAIITIFTDVLVGIMFVDAVKNGFTSLYKGDDIIEFNKNVWDTRSKKFHSQRNLYILGAIIALQGSIWFIMMMLRSIVKNKAILVELSKKSGGKDESTKELEDELSKLQLDVGNLNKQYDSLWNAYQEKNKVSEESNVDKKDK